MGLRELLNRSCSNRHARRRAHALARPRVKQSLRNHVHSAADGGNHFESLEPRVLLSANVWTDKLDYAPGETAIVMGTGYQTGEAVELQVLHIGAGADGEFGTDDDTLGDNTGSGHEPWYVTDGGLGDLDGVADGNIQTEWYVNPDDSLDETFRLTATGQTSGEVATAIFTDSGGDYSDMDFSAAAPLLYDPIFPFQFDQNGPPADLGAFPSGRFDGSTVLPGADGGQDVTVESLQPEDLALGQIVPFELRVDTDDVPDGDCFTFVVGFETETTPGDPFGFDEDWGVVAAFVDSGDAANTDPTATVDSLSWTLVGTEIQATIEVCDVSDFSTIVVEMWVVLDEDFPEDDPPGGNVQTRLIDAFTSGDNPESDESISTGNQTVPLLQVASFTSVTADLSVIKSDNQDDPTVITTNDDPVSGTDFSVIQGQQFTYTILATNHSTTTVANEVTVTDVLDAGVTFVLGTIDVTDTIGNITTAGDFTFTPDGTNVTGGTLIGDLGSLLPGEEVIITFDVIATSDPNGDGQFLNTVTIDAITDDDNPDNNMDEEPTVFIPFVPNPANTIDKTASSITNPDGSDGGDTVDEAGDVINYEIAVENTGNVGLTSVVVTDPLLGGILAGPASGDADNDGELDVDETWIYLASYTVTQADINAGGNIDLGDDGNNDVLRNEACVVTDQTDELCDTVDVPVDEEPGLTIDKALVTEGFKITNPDGSDGGDTVDEAGDMINYSITVDNTGNQTLTNVVVVDPLLGGILAGPASGDADNDGELDVDETWIYLASYTVTQADINAGGNIDLGDDGNNDVLRNEACVVTDQTDELCDTVDVPVDEEPGLTIDKALVTEGFKITNPDGSDGGDTVDEAGDMINYSITVDNTGNQTLTNVVVVDPLLGGILAGPASGDADNDGELDVDETWIYLASYTVTQADINAGGNIDLGDDGNNDVLRNEACVVTDQTDELCDTVDVPVDEEPGLTIDKALVTEGFKITNPDGSDGGDTVDEAGDMINYSITVDNTGNQTLTNVVVVDPLLGGILAGPASGDADNDGELDVDETWIYLASYTVTQADINAGGNIDLGDDGNNDVLRNEACVVTDQTDELCDTVDVPVDEEPGLTIDKALVTEGFKITNPDGSDGGDTVDEAGDMINYSITVDNTGNQTLTNVVVVDPLLGGILAGPASGDADNDGELDVDETWIYLASYTVTQADINAGGNIDLGDDGNNDVLRNEACVVTDQTDELCDTVDVPVDQNPSINLEKLAQWNDDGDSRFTIGDTLLYTFEVTNNGNVTLHDVTVSEDQFDLDPTRLTIGPLVDSALLNGAGVLVPGETEIATATYILNQDEEADDIDRIFEIHKGDGQIDNSAIATGLSPRDEEVEDDSEAFIPIPDGQAPIPNIEITKEFAQDSVIAGGVGGSFTLVVKNTGDVTLSGALIFDDVDDRLKVTGVSGTAGADADSDGDAQTIEWLIPTLPVNGDSVEITVNFEVDASVPEANGVGGPNDEPSVLNTVDVSAETPGGNPEDPNDDVTDTGEDTIDILTEIELSIDKNFYRIDDMGTTNTGDDIRVDDGAIEQGATGFFELIVGNDGPSDALDVLVEDTVSGLLEVMALTLPAGWIDLDNDGDPLTGDGDLQTIEVEIPTLAVNETGTIVVEYQAAEFLDPDEGPIFGTQEGDEFQFIFVNGYTILGSSDTDGAATLIVIAPDGFEQTFPYDGTKNEIVFDPSLILDADGNQVFPNDPSFIMHLSCSDPFTGGWGQSDGPVEGVDVNWQISLFSILRYNQNGFFKGCGDVVQPIDVPNTATADGTDSNSHLNGDEQVSDTDMVQIIRQLKIEARSDLSLKGKKGDVLLFNSGEDPLTITQIEITWPDGSSGNGDLVEVLLGGNTIYDTVEGTSPATIDGDDGDGSPWVGDRC